MSSPEFPSSSPTLFPFQITVEVTFRDLDAMGHVNHAVYLTYMETARTRFMMELLALSQPADMPVILAEVSCTYHSPALFGERLTVGLGVSRFGTKSFDILYDIRAQDGRAVATGKTVMVTYDYQNGRPIPIPAELQAKILSLQGSWQAKT
jgi:acyl-CoA thioester hydrolase